MTDSKIYLGTDGAYHDDTDVNRAQYPAAEDQPDAPEAAEGLDNAADAGSVGVPTQEPGAESPEASGSTAKGTSKNTKA